MQQKVLCNIQCVAIPKCCIAIVTVFTCIQQMRLIPLIVINNQRWGLIARKESACYCCLRAEYRNSLMCYYFRQTSAKRTRVFQYMHNCILLEYICAYYLNIYIICILAILAYYLRDQCLAMMYEHIITTEYAQCFLQHNILLKYSNFQYLQSKL